MSWNDSRGFRVGEEPPNLANPSNSQKQSGFFWFAVRLTQSHFLGGILSQLKSGPDKNVLITQYKDLIHAAVSECESAQTTNLNIGKLQSKLKVICKAAEYDGLPEDTIVELINEVSPVKAPKIA